MAGSSPQCLLLLLLLAISGRIIPGVSGLFKNGSITAPCDSPIYCYGELLHEVELAQPFEDSKTFVDLPTIRPLDDVLAAFAALPRPLSNDSALHEFLAHNFGRVGSELERVPAAELTSDPAFLANVVDQGVSKFTRAVIAIWPDLVRRYRGEGEIGGRCNGCVDSFLSVKRPFVIAGGRFREPYYWDSFWIIEGLLRTRGSYTGIARNMIENFLDFVESFGFVPNGARIYYLNRSQPPLLAMMVQTYVRYTGDKTILTRAVPLLEREMEFWAVNRSIEIRHPSTAEIHVLNHYAVRNNQPRPETYREDFETVNGKLGEPTGMGEGQKARLYQNIVSAVESGWDFSSRWISGTVSSTVKQGDRYALLRALNTVDIVPVDLNSILYGAEAAIAEFHEQMGNEARAEVWRATAARRSLSMHALLWNEDFFGYFDYNIASSSQNLFVPISRDPGASSEGKKRGANEDYSSAMVPPGTSISFHAAQLFPFWTGAATPALRGSAKAVRKAYRHVGELLEKRAGAITTTNQVTGEQWDAPNVWPPLLYAMMKGLLSVNAAQGGDPDSRWAQETAGQLAQRYLATTVCAWRATEKKMGRGVMFEKYNDYAAGKLGVGGEYEVVEGFGWSNGVLIWMVDVFGRRLTMPECGDL